jgi:hypothetical protein
MRHNHADVAVAGGIAILGYAAAMANLPAAVMIVLGIGLFAAPGYVWSEVLLSPRVTGLERIAVATGLALMTPIFGGLVLYAAGIPLRRTSWTGLLAVVTLVGVMALTIQRWKTELPASARQAPAGRHPAWHAAAFGAAAVITIGAVALAVAGAEAQKYPGYTQLWMSPLQQEPLAASLGVTNQQGSTMQYRLVLLRKGQVSATWNLTLASGQTWQRTITFTDKYSVVADLYRLPDLSHPYRNVTNGD